MMFYYRYLSIIPSHCGLSDIGISRLSKFVIVTLSSRASLQAALLVAVCLTRGRNRRRSRMVLCGLSPCSSRDTCYKANDGALIGCLRAASLATQSSQIHAHQSSPVSIQTQSLALCALRKRKPQETEARALASSQSWLSLLRPSNPNGWRLRFHATNASASQ